MTGGCKIIQGASALLMASCAVLPAFAQSSGAGQDDRLILWHNLRVGMSKAEVKALLPQKLVPLTDGCYLVVSPQFKPAKGLIRVDLQFSWQDRPENRCGLVVLRTLTDKYGEPEQEADDVERHDCGNSYSSGVAGALAKLCESAGGDEPSYYRYMRWSHDEVEINLKIDTKADNPQWWMAYRPVVTAAEDAGGKL